jgi:prolyl-tRNA editing enzyme YbaK/EbsC (Cys-tRNA(Pro) deacylase)
MRPLYGQAGTVHLPARSRLVHDALRSAGIQGEIVVLPDAASTAALAAAALGIEVGAIANSLVFWSDGEPLLVMTSGAHRVDTKALAERLGRTSIARATPEQVRDATGQAIGGVAPTGHPAPLTTVVDEALAEFPEIWAAGGTPHTVFPLTFDELVRLTGAPVVKVD